MNEKVLIITLIMCAIGMTIFMFGHIRKSDLLENIGATGLIITGIVITINYFTGGY